MSDKKDCERFTEGDIVIRKDTGERGIVVMDPWGACTEEEIPVVYEGDEAYIGTDWRLLEKPLTN